MMWVKALLSVILILLLSGCATTRKGYDSEIMRLENRVNSIETELQVKGEAIDRLEEEFAKSREKQMPTRDEKDRSYKLSIKQIQAVLKDARFYKGPIDGKIGPATIEAIKAFQRANNLKPDGVVGNKTKAKIERYLTEYRSEGSPYGLKTHKENIWLKNDIISN